MAFFELKSTLFTHWKDHTLEPVLESVWSLPHGKWTFITKESVLTDFEKALDNWLELAHRNGIKDEETP